VSVRRVGVTLTVFAPLFGDRRKKIVVASMFCRIWCIRDGKDFVCDVIRGEILC